MHNVIFGFKLVNKFSAAKLARSGSLLKKLKFCITVFAVI